ncbi:MAG: hypothetical protein JWM27_656 [Gemmatimonadetes bacterium]|nr:hypothetical protein [Gemmatimonadota bacterium]
MRHAATGALRALALSLLTLATPLAAQNGVVDAGTFRVFVDGRAAGTEDFSIRQAGSGTASDVTATGHVSVQLPTGTLELSPRLRATGLGADPVSYQVDVGGSSPQRIVGTVGSGRFSAKIVTAAGEQLREYVVSSGALVLDDGVAHHYYFLAQRGAARVPVIIPRENRQALATVTRRGEEQTDVGGRSVRAYHLVVQVAGGPDRHVWVDALNRVLKVEIPDRSYLAVRTEIPR